MTETETLKIVTRACVIDRREPSDLMVQVWHEAIGHLDYAVALAALSIAIREETSSLRPAHILRRTAQARSEIRSSQMRPLLERRRAYALEQERQAIES